jgi:hypothetical protein
MIWGILKIALGFVALSGLAAVIFFLLCLMPEGDNAKNTKLK